MNRIALEDLTEEERDEIFTQTMEHLGELVEACGEFAPDSAHVASHVVLDERGLLEMELFPYREDVDMVEEDLDMLLPEALVGCLDDEIWDRPWPSVSAGSELPLALTLPIEGEAAE